MNIVGRDHLTRDSYRAFLVVFVDIIVVFIVFIEEKE
jgi:hypothetical protein